MENMRGRRHFFYLSPDRQRGNPDFGRLYLDELMMNLFSLIADQVRNKQELFDEEGKIMQTLLNIGYPLHEADAALTLMQSLVQKQAENFFGPDEVRDRNGMRTMSSEERRRFTPEAFAFTVKLTHLGVLSENQREEIFERTMTLYRERIELDHIKAMVAFTLFTSSQERQDPPFSGLDNIKNTSWN
jgi:uncharacterized protein Smg (DUF494 family)